MRSSDLEALRRLLWEEVPKIMEALEDRPIGTVEAAKIMGYSSTGMILQNIEFFKGYRTTENGNWKFSRAYIRDLARSGKRPTFRMKKDPYAPRR